MQLHAFAQLLMDHPEYKSQGMASSEDPVRLVLLGGARHQDDLDRVESLRALAKELDIQVGELYRQICCYLLTVHVRTKSRSL